MSPHCWTGYLEWLKEQQGNEDGEVAWINEGSPSQTCMLEDGHAGPHEWTHDGDIIVRFSAGTLPEVKEK